MAENGSAKHNSGRDITYDSVLNRLSNQWIWSGILKPERGGLGSFYISRLASIGLS